MTQFQVKYKNNLEIIKIITNYFLPSSKSAIEILNDLTTNHPSQVSVFDFPWERVKHQVQCMWLRLGDEIIKPLINRRMSQKNKI